MEGYYERAVETYSVLAEDPRQRIEAEIGLARCRLRIGEYAEAIAALTGLEASDSPDWHYALAQLRTRIGEYEAALHHARSAMAIDKHHAGARLLLGRTLELLGRRDEAIEAYRWFEGQVLGRPELPPDAGWVTSAAMGFLRYSVLTQTNVPRRTQHVLNEMLQIAYGRLDPTYWPARIAAADLLLEKFNNDEEDGSVSEYKAALRINSNLCEAHVGLGRVALEGWDFEETERRATRALEINPNYSPAIHLLAAKSLLESRYDKALETCALALQINPNDLMALSISAAASACQYDDTRVEALRRRVAKLNPACALFHRTLGDAYSGIHQHAASEQAYRKAIGLDGTDANARTKLGMLYMRWGLEEKAREVLEAAWSLDPYNQRTKFTLELLEQLENFARYETDHFIVKYDGKQDPVLGESVGNYLETIYEQLTSEYDMPLAEKTIVEMFPTQSAFAIRVSGKPWIQTVGACTGRVIAMASPRTSAELMGPYDVASVLIHEFTHTVTLAATQYRIPRWFTEGLAVSQESYPRSFAWWSLLAEAARRDRTYTLDSIDWGFIRPERPGDSSRAYAQGNMTCEYIIERFGDDAIGAMLDGFRDGLSQREVFVEELSIEPENFDRDFAAWARDKIAGWGFELTPPESVLMLRGFALLEDDNASAHGRLARAAYDDGDNERALQAARRAIDLDENNPDGLEIAAKVLAARAKKEPLDSRREALEDEMLPLLERLTQVDPDGWTGPKLLARILLDRKEYDRAIEPLKRLQRLCPLDPASWQGLARIYMERGEHDLALPQFLELARTELLDPNVPAQIALIKKRQGLLHEARYWYRQALFIDPSNVHFHQALGDTAMRAHDTSAALRQYKMLIQLEPDKAKHFEQAAFAAHKLGDSDEAQRLARRAVDLDPNSPARSLLPMLELIEQAVDELIPE